MNLTTWNNRGLGSKRKKRILTNRIKEENPDMVFIQEKKCSIDKIREIHRKWLIKYEYPEFKANNTVGGILTLWNPRKFGILDAEASRNYLSMVIQPLGDNEIYMVTNVYGPQNSKEKLKLLTSLEVLRKRHPDMPWILGGDFNMIKSLLEKRGGTKALSKYSIPFQTFTDNMNVVDTETSNVLFYME